MLPNFGEKFNGIGVAKPRTGRRFFQLSAFFGFGNVISRKSEKIMGILTRALIDHLKEVGWALFLIILLLACLWVIFGRHLGYETIFWICLSFAVIVTAVLMMII